MYIQNKFFIVIAVIQTILVAPDVNGQTPSAPNQLQAQQQPTSATFPPRQPMRLNIMGKEQFCSRLAQVFNQFGLSSGYNAAQSALLASGATSKIIQDFRTGRASDFVNSRILLADVRLPVLQPAQGYLQLANFIGKALGVSENASLALTSGELRYLPHFPREIDLVVIAQNAAALSLERVNKISELARSMKIRVSVVWVGNSQIEQQDIDDARVLAWIAASTGGTFANMGGNEVPCSVQSL